MTALSVEELDEQLARTAGRLTRDLHHARPVLYWTDLLFSSTLGYAGLLLAMSARGGPWLRLGAGMLAAFALYRGVSFIHELTHLKASAVPGFWWGWNVLIGVPLLLPSFAYEGVHNLHHVPSRYGTARDPEYLPLAHMRPVSLVLFLVVSALVPVGLWSRFAVLGPLSWFWPRLRRLVVERASSLIIETGFRREPPVGRRKWEWWGLELACTLWAWTVLALVAMGVIAPRAFGVFLVVASAVAVLNQVRTLVAHLWENDGRPMSVTAQFLDSVNVPPPGVLAVLWAPVGLRYHALHHLLPGLPYHALGQAHRRLVEAMPPPALYPRASHPGLGTLLRRLFARSAVTAREAPRGTR
ncbi:fatty acid desaturase family protein [Melittangium boletus]|uniref:fatty acid desaturase family protein n=1 Tax=Melittangium boletus TaxID=83453 RepID=UPI003DA6BEDE